MNSNPVALALLAQTNELTVLSMRKYDSYPTVEPRRWLQAFAGWSFEHVRARLVPYPIGECSVALLRIAVSLVHYKSSLNDLRFRLLKDRLIQRTMAQSSNARLIDAECRCLLDRTERDGWDGSVILRLKANSLPYMTDSAGNVGGTLLQIRDSGTTLSVSIINFHTHSGA